MTDTVTTAREVFTGKAGHAVVPASRLDFFRGHIRPKVAGYHVPWSFERHEYLEAVVTDESHSITVRKAAQVGVSTMAIGTMLHVAGQGYHVGYYLPTKDDIEPFVQARFDPVIDADETLAKLVVEGDPNAELSAAAQKRRKSADNTRLKKLGRGQMWFQGCQKMKDVKSIDLDLIIRDEVDELDPELQVFINDRILHSTYRRSLALSQPSVPGFGIDAEFEASDQKHWLLRCARCRKWTCLEESFPSCLVRIRGEWRLVCAHCHARLPYLTRSDPSAAEWVAKFPDRSGSGYCISQLYGPATDPAHVAELNEKAQKSAIHAENLAVSIKGLPHAGERQPISDAAFKAACSDVTFSPRRLDGAVAAWAGIDVGDVLYLTIGSEFADGTIQVHWFQAIPVTDDDWDPLIKVLLAANVQWFVIDSRPEKTMAKRLCRTPGLHGAVCSFPMGVEQAAYGLEDEKTTQPVHYLKAPRSDVIQEMCDDLRGGAMRLPSARHETMTVVKSHLQKLVKDRTDRGWDFKTGVENHYGLALTYLRLAKVMATALGLGPAVPLAGGEWSIPREEARTQW